mgnify:CR=1 FL=1
MVTNQLNWGDPNTFQIGGWDDFDGKIRTISYEMSRFGKVQIYIQIMPERYEYEKRGFTYDPDAETGLPHGWYPLGNIEAELEADGLDANFPTAPYKSTRGVKLITSVIEHSGAQMNGASLRPLIGAQAHWKMVEESVYNPETTISTKKDFMFAVSPPLGSATAPDIDQSIIDGAVALMADIFTDEETKFVRNSRIPEYASKFDYSREVVEFASSDAGIQHLIDLGAITREDDRTISA